MLPKLLVVLWILLCGTVRARVASLEVLDIVPGNYLSYGLDIGVQSSEQERGVLSTNTSRIVSLRGPPNPQAPNYQPYDFPNRGPQFWNFRTDPLSEERLRKVAAAWLEALHLLNAANWALCQTNGAFTRYFTWSEFHTVHTVVNALLGPDNKGAPAVTDPIKPLAIAYVDPALYPDDPCKQHPRMYAYTEQDNHWIYPSRPPRTFIFICPAIFDVHPRSLVSWDCDHAPQYINEEYDTISGTLLHELMHWDGESDRTGMTGVLRAEWRV